MKLKELEKLAKEYNRLTTLNEQLEWIINHQDCVTLCIDTGEQFPVLVDADGDAYDTDEEKYKNLDLNCLVENIRYGNALEMLLKKVGIESCEWV